MKKILAVSLMLASSSVFAAALTGVQTVCSGGNAAPVDIGGGSGTIVTTPAFIRNGFQFQCSNNVFLVAQEVSTTVMTVGSASAKGNQYFGGSSNGGAITAINKCAAACTVTDAQSGNTAAAGSS